MKRILATGILGFWATFMLTGALYVPDKAELGVVKNYIANGGIERGKAGFATYKDAAGAQPVDGTGGSPTHITTATTTSAPLKDSTSLNIVNSGATSAQGEGASYDFSIDSSDQASVVNVSFDYSLVSGTFQSGSINGSTITDSDLEVFVYDVTNALVIQPSGYVLTCGSVVAAKCTNPAVTFQAASNSTSYRLIWHVATTNAVAWTMKVDNIVASRMVKQYGSPISDWASFTPTFTGFGTATAIDFRWRRVGSNLEVQGRATAGTTTAVEARVSFPAGLTSTSNLSTLSVVGGTVRTTAAAGSFWVLAEPSVTYFTFSLSGAGNSGAAKGTGSGLFASSDVVSFFASVPIAGWSSSVQMSDSADTRVASLTANKSAGSVTANTTIPTWTNVTKDTHGAFNASTGVYTCPVAGDYQVNFTAYTTTGSPVAQIRKNGTLLITGVTGAVVNSGTVSGLVPSCNAGDTISVSVDTSLTLTTSTVQTTLAIYRLSGPASIAASESVTARYHNTATSISGSLTTISWTTADFDSHNGMSAGTYTVPTSGKYQVNTCLATNCSSTAAGQTIDLQVQKNGTAFSEFLPSYQSNVTNIPVCLSDTINAVAGDTLRVQISSSCTSPSIVSSNSRNFFSVERVGN